MGSTLADVFPELKNKMDAEFAKITFQELLSHTSDLSDGPQILDLISHSYMQDDNLDEIRYWIAKEIAPKPLDHPRVSKLGYSNLGYTIAVAILERTGGKTWEELVNERIIGPLDLKTAGFGPQASLGKVDAPLGHLIVDGKPKAMLAGPNGDNPARYRARRHYAHVGARFCKMAGLARRRWQASASPDFAGYREKTPHPDDRYRRS
jgi:CubicO group peptidase (beta-lactamase class C family)